jgi:hypothetical protein
MMPTVPLGTSFHDSFLLGIFSTLKIEATRSSKYLTDFKQTISHHIPEERTLHEVNALALGKY